MADAAIDYCKAMGDDIDHLIVLRVKALLSSSATLGSVVDIVTSHVERPAQVCPALVESVLPSLDSFTQVEVLARAVVSLGGERVQWGDSIISLCDAVASIDGYFSFKRLLLDPLSELVHRVTDANVIRMRNVAWRLHEAWSFLFCGDVKPCPIIEAADADLALALKKLGLSSSISASFEGLSRKVALRAAWLVVGCIAGVPCLPLSFLSSAFKEVPQFRRGAASCDLLERIEMGLRIQEALPPSFVCDPSWRRSLIDAEPVMALQAALISKMISPPIAAAAVTAAGKLFESSQYLLTCSSLLAGILSSFVLGTDCDLILLDGALSVLLKHEPSYDCQFVRKAAMEKSLAKPLNRSKLLGILYDRQVISITGNGKFESIQKAIELFDVTVADHPIDCVAFVYSFLCNIRPDDSHAVVEVVISLNLGESTHQTVIQKSRSFASRNDTVSETVDHVMKSVWCLLCENLCAGRNWAALRAALRQGARPSLDRTDELHLVQSVLEVDEGSATATALWICSTSSYESLVALGDGLLQSGRKIECKWGWELFCDGGAYGLSSNELFCELAMLSRCQDQPAAELKFTGHDGVACCRLIDGAVLFLCNLVTMRRGLVVAAVLAAMRGFEGLTPGMLCDSLDGFLISFSSAGKDSTLIGLHEIAQSTLSEIRAFQDELNFL